MPELVSLIIHLLEATQVIPTITPRDVINYLEKENSNARYECSVQPSRNSASYYGTQPSIASCESRNANAPAQDSQ